MQSKITSNVLLAVLAVSLFFNISEGKMYYKNYIDIPPDHPNSQFTSLFPGRDYTNSVGITDWDQFFADHFLFLVAGEEGVPYQLFTINRQGCRSFSGVAINDKQSVDFTSFINSAVLIRDYIIDENGTVIIKDLDEDTFVNEHIAEYQEACAFPIERMSEHILLMK